MTSQDCIHQANAAFINRFDFLNELIDQLKNQLDVYGRSAEGETLNIQGRVSGINRQLGLSDDEFRVLVAAKKANNRTNCSIGDLEKSVAIIIDNDFEIIDNRSSFLTLKVYGASLSNFERSALVQYLPRPASLSWEILEEATTSKYNTSKFGGNKYINPIIGEED
jgi:hypothetical protein